MKYYLIIFLVLSSCVSLGILQCQEEVITFTDKYNLEICPLWGNDSQNIYFSYFEGEQLVISKLDIYSKEIQEINKGNQLLSINPIDNTLLVAGYNDKSISIKILSDNGKLIKILSIQPDNIWPPIWSPDGKIIVFLTGRKEYPFSERNIVFYDVEKDEIIKELKTHPDLFPTSWNYKNEILGIGGIDKKIKTNDKVSITTDYNLFFFNLNNGIYRQLTNYSNTEKIISYPEWAPDCQKVICTLSYDNTKGDIAILDRSGNIIRIFSNESINSYYLEPTWSPDGKKIAFTLSELEVGDDYPKYSLGVIELDPSLQSGPRPDKIPDIRIVTFNVYLYGGITIGIILVVITGYALVKRRRKQELK